MNRSLKLVLGLGLCVTAASLAHADTITSTVAGGPWANSATWLGGAAPGADDDVIVNGPVEVTGTAACLSLSVTELGYVGGAFAGPNNTLAVSGAVTNAGTIDDGAFNFFVEVGGDLYNEGVWANHQTTVTGTADRHLGHAPDYGFETDIVFGAGASGDLIVDNPLAITGDVNVTGGRMVLLPDCPFTLDRGAFSGELLANGNEMRFVSWSYLTYCSIDDVVLVGEVEASILVNFTTSVTVADTLHNLPSTGNGAVTVEGDMVNNGVIRNNQYGFALFLYGDLENNGAITCSQVAFEGDLVHHLSMSPDAVIDANVFLPEFLPRTLVADTPVRFADGLGLGIEGTLILTPGSSLGFTGFGGVGSGIILAGGNEISVDGTGGIGHVTIDQGVLAGPISLLDTVLFTGGVTVTGTVTSWEWAAAEITVDGTLRNEGVIADGAHHVWITALGDIENLGTFENGRIVLDGTEDQTVGAGMGIAVPLFVIESNLEAVSYQWYRDGVPMPGETAANLLFNTVGENDYGIYRCEGGGGEVSRTIVINEGGGPTDVPTANAMVVLEQNHPNPFNPATVIAFELRREIPVRLVVYDVAGREVDTLVDRELSAGRHQVTWQPRGLPSGTYVYRLRAGDVDLIRKCALLK